MKRLILLFGFIILQILFIKNALPDTSYNRMANTEGSIKVVKDISGYWRTKSGAVYHFFHENGSVVATFYRPNEYQASCGIKAGDLAYKGTLIGRVMVGTFQQRLPLTEKERCPGAWLTSNNLYLQISDTFDRMEGTLLVEHYPGNSCHSDDRRLDLLVFEPTTPDEVRKMSSSALPKAFEEFSSGG